MNPLVFHQQMAATTAAYDAILAEAVKQVQSLTDQLKAKDEEIAQLKQRLAPP